MTASTPAFPFWTDPRNGTSPGTSPATDSVLASHPTLEPLAPREEDDAPPALGVGDRIAGRYLLGEQIADGGMGTLWSATDAQSGDEVVVKLMSVDLLDNEEAVQRFELEAAVVASIRSPHVVGFIDYGVFAGSPYIVLERLVGEDLEIRLRRGRLPLSECAHLLEQMAHALLAAHVKGVIHRDVKPANIFLAETDGRETVKLLDFGIAKLREGARIRTGAGVTVGSPEFMSPEQVQGKPSIDGRSDLFGLAAVLYACITGTIPFAGVHVADTFQRILRGVYTPPTQLVPELPPSVDAFFRKALAIEAQERFQNAAEMAAEFRELVETARIMSRPPPWRAPQPIGVPSQPAPRKRGRLGDRKSVMFSSAAVLALLGAALATSAWAGDPPPPAAATTEIGAQPPRPIVSSAKTSTSTPGE